MQVIVQDILTHYDKQGEGPVLLFIHGWGDNSQTFIPLINQLKKQFTCVALDLPGSGQSHEPEKAWGIEEYAQFVAAFTKKIKSQPSVVLGHSNGGTITLFATAHKLLVPNKIVLLASAGIRSEGGLKKNMYKLIAKSGKQASRLFGKKVQQKLRRKLYSSAGSDMLVAPHLEETFKKVVSYDILDDAKNIELPALLLYAADDTATPPRYGVALHEAIKDSQLEVMPSGGHFLQLTNTNSIADKIKEFLK